MNELAKAIAEYQRLLVKVEQNPKHFEAALTFFEGNGTTTIRWLTTPALALNNLCPIECELEKVKEFLGVLEHGVYV